MVQVFQDSGVEVTYVLYPDEGHGLQRAENSFSFWAMAEALARRDDPERMATSLPGSD